MRFQAGVILALAALTVAGCGDRRTHTATDPQSGERVTMESGSGARAPANMPDFAPIYRGARIENAMAGSSSGQTGANQGGMVTYRVDASADQVETFYRQALDRSDLTERSEVNSNGVRILAAGSPDNPDRSLQVSIAPNPDGPGSYVTLVYSLGEG